MFLFVVSALGLDVVDNINTLLGCFFFLFLLKTLLALIVTSLFVITSICGALRNPIEAILGEIFGHNRLESKCFQVHPITCCDLLVFL